MAHAIDRLALLYPYPDAVRGFALHKTLTSSRLTARSQPYDEPRGTISLAVADCKYRAPLPPRLYDRFLLYYKFFHFSRCFLIYFLSDCDDFCFAGHGAMWHRPLHTIFCDIVGDDARIVPFFCFSATKKTV